MLKQHQYTVTVDWTGNMGEGTSNYQNYDRSHTISVEGKPVILGSSDPAFRGDNNMYNPEEMFVAALSACHMLWYLHLCAEAGVVVTHYSDSAKGIMEESTNDRGRFTSVTLFPKVQVQDHSMIAKANELHQLANKKCFIANSCNFPVHHQPVCTVS